MTRHKNELSGFFSPNIAGIDPMPHFRLFEARVKELKEDFKPEDYEKMIRRIAKLELDLEQKEIEE